MYWIQVQVVKYTKKRTFVCQEKNGLKHEDNIPDTACEIQLGSS